MKYQQLRDECKANKFHLYEMDFETALNGESVWHTVAIVYSLSFGEFYIVAGYFRKGEEYRYMSPEFFEPLSEAIQKEVFCVDALEEERQRWREAYLDQRKSA